MSAGSQRNKHVPSEKKKPALVATNKIRAWIFDELIEVTPMDPKTEIQTGLLIQCDAIRIGPTSTVITIEQALNMVGANDGRNAIAAKVPKEHLRGHNRPTGSNVYYIFRQISTKSIEYYGVGCIWPVGTF
jgi:hypothetical protein